MMLSVVIPVYNEAATLERVVQAVRKTDVGLDKHLIIVDDGSTDGTREILRRLGEHPDITVYLHEHNRGKGAALRTGIARATGELVIIQDADLEYDPHDYARLIEPIHQDRADVVYGSRMLEPKNRPTFVGWHRRANQLLTWLSNRFTGLRLTDMETCYKLFRRPIIQAIDIEERSFGVEPEITAKIAKQNVRVVEVGITYAGRSYDEGKKITWRDGLHAVWCILKYSLPNRKKSENSASA